MKLILFKNRWMTFRLHANKCHRNWNSYLLRTVSISFHSIRARIAHSHNIYVVDVDPEISLIYFPNPFSRIVKTDKLLNEYVILFRVWVCMLYDIVFIARAQKLVWWMNNHSTKLDFNPDRKKLNAVWCDNQITVCVCICRSKNIVNKCLLDTNPINR